MARFGELSAAEVWAASSRTLSSFGTLVTDVWAAASRTLSAFDARTLFDLPLAPSYYPAVDVAASASANTFGSWVQLKADVGTSRRLIGVTLVTPTSQNMSVEVEIGEGGVGAESAVARVSYIRIVTSDVGYVPLIYIPLWVKLTDNARLSARSKCSFAAAFSTYVSPLVV